MTLTERILIICVLAVLAVKPAAQAQGDTATAKSRLIVGGYGEAVYNHNFYSDNVFRYSFPDRYKQSAGHGRVDLPHAVLMLGYDFGHGWTMGTEIEFEHGGTESAVEIETEETGEFEKEIERGGEVALEQFWIQKSFAPALNLRMGHIVVPVGMTNSNHLPTQFFTVYRPEGENTIMPCTWHETGVSLWGRWRSLRYEAQLLPGLNSNYFNNSGWVHDGSASPYEFRPANKLAGAVRVDFTGIKGLRLSLSGYVGNSFNNDIVTDKRTRYDDVKGTVLIGAFDFAYRNRWLVVRGNADYGHLSDAAVIGPRNQNQNHSTSSPYPHTLVGEKAMATGIEAGVDVLAATNTRHKLFLFGRYDYYDSFIPADGQADFGWSDRNVFTAGVNYYPIPEIAIKAEGGIRILGEEYNNEPFVAVGVTWAGYFNK
ncbi:MAG: hypothetical protein K5650_05695 [Bacteroidales bacterium]|nr:hypothetical protein [Bacteroidales bacterium]